MPERILNAATKMSELTTAKVGEIQNVTRTAKILAMNALIEASRAGEAGRGFAVVASEVNTISQRVTSIATELQGLFADEARDLRVTAQTVRGSRLSDLALYVIELIDRNLYERSCDVRWWATDSAVVDGCIKADDLKAVSWASKRLGVILDSYTVYLDLWIADRHGRVIANGRPERYGVKGVNVSSAAWFKQAMATRNGGDYATAVRSGGEVDGEVIGAMGIFFDWESQAESVVNSVSLPAEERERTTIMIVDRDCKVIASSDHLARAGEFLSLRIDGAKKGAYLLDDESIVAYALTPGFETYEGLGWRGVIVQKPTQSFSIRQVRSGANNIGELVQR